MERRVRQFVESFNSNLEWPEAVEITPHAQTCFRQAGRIFDDYRGNPKVLIEAVRVCMTGDCRPYAFAAIATAIQIYSFQHDDKYDKDGLREALQWLELAQKIAPDRPEINVIEVSIYICMKRLSDARTVLDHIARDNPDFPGLPRTEMWYWDRIGNHKQWLMWSKRALDLARDEHDRLTLLHIVAGYYLMKKMYPEALAATRKVLAIDPADPWAWHNMSVAFLHQRQYSDAQAANLSALKIMDFPAAREIEKQIKSKRTLLGGWKKD